MQQHDCSQESAEIYPQQRLKYQEIPSTRPVGRPRTGWTYLNRLRVPAELKNELLAAADATGTTLPALRRQAYRDIVKNLDICRDSLQ